MKNDFKSAIRQLLKNPGFTAIAVFTLALGIGANTAMYSIVRGVLLKPLPYPHPERLVTLSERDTKRGMEQGLVSGPNFLDWKERNTVFESLALNPGWQGAGDVNLVQRDGVVKIKSTYVPASFFSTLGVGPLLGRTFVTEEDKKQGNRAAVLSHRLWQSRFGGASNVIGQTLSVDTYGRRDYTIVGVMPPGFGVPSETELWLPLGWMGVSLDERRSAHWHHVLGRLKPGISLEQAQAEMNTIQASLVREHPEADIGSEVSVIPLLQHAVGRNLQRALLVLWGVVAGVLLIACVNVANLLLARTAGRRREIAIRVALGASRWRVFRQLLVESLCLALLGGTIGILFAHWGVKLFVLASPGNIPRVQEITLDGAALGLTLLISGICGVLFGLAPGWQSSRPNLNATLQETGRGTSTGRPAHRLRQVLVVSEVALSLMLLIGAGLMIRSFARLVNMDRGFEPEHLVTAELDYSVSGFTTWVQPTATRPQITQHEVLQRLRQQPGVRSAAVASGLPRRNAGPPTQPILIQGRSLEMTEDLPKTDCHGVSPDYFRTMGVPLLRGRDFTEAERLEAAQVVIINQTMARRYFPNQDPIGKQIAFPGRNNPRQPESSPWQTNGPWREIVGLVADMKSLTLFPEPVPQIYFPYWQWPMQSPTLVLRTTNSLASVAALIRNEVKAVVPNLPTPPVRTMDKILADTTAQPRFQTWLLSLFALIALVLAAVGLYGVIAYAVSQRTQEIGIRMALGAQKRNVLLMIIGRGMGVTLIGVAIGLVASLWLSRVMRSLLYEITPTDLTTFVGVSLLLVLVTLVACWIPARRAARVDPMVALRYE